jgi:c-di-GMP-binding flagellar brake protein YcgR
MSHATISADEQRFHVHNEKEILQILNDLAKRKVTLSVSFNHGNEGFLTTVVTVDNEKRLAYLDIGQDDTFNDRLVASHDVAFANNEGVRVCWTSSSLRIATLKDGKAICIGLPHDLIRLQRREFHRLTTPTVNPVICRIPVASESGADSEDTFLEFPLVDISVGGIGILAPDALDDRLSVGAEFNNCKIDLPNVGTTSLTLRVKHVTQVIIKEEIIRFRVGLEFINPSRGNQALIQRYTFILETETVALQAP